MSSNSSSGQWQLPPVDRAAEAREESRRRILRGLFWVVSIVVFVVVAGAFFLPSEVTVTRSITIRVPRLKVYEQLYDFRKWQAWGPWFRRDKFLETSFSGPEFGPGSMMSWSSKKEGDGRLKMLVSDSHKVQVAVDFGDRGEAETQFNLADSDDKSMELTWTFKVDFGSNMARRYFGLMMRGPVERDLDEGLANLKALVEGSHPAAP